MKSEDQDGDFKIISIQKRFFADYEYVVGSDKAKTLIKKIGKKRGKYQVFDDPNFDIFG